MIEGNHAIRRVTTADAAKADELLNSEIEGIIPTALKLNHGIRVIRLGPGNYVVETAPEVTCGYTVYEQ